MDPKQAYAAMLSRDPRFDGVFYVGVTSTGIYCRPVCPVRTPKAANCRFFPSAEAAEVAAFRPCLRCRPELAPGLAPMDKGQRIAQLVATRMDEGLGEDGEGLDAIAASLDLSGRQLRRIVQAELGAPPMALIQTRRLLLAKQLLTETQLPVTEIAFASGFSSLRRFNDAFQSRYRMPPTRLRKTATEAHAPASNEMLTLRMSYRPPLDWPWLLQFLGARAIRGVEVVDAETYARTARIGQHTGWLRVRHGREPGALSLELSPSLTPALPTLLRCLRNLFDLFARPDIISAHLAQDPLLTPRVACWPGMRVPGAFDSFEMAIRAILGQQITVKAATTIACRYAQAFGEPVETPIPGLTHLTPSAARIASVGESDIAKLGIVSARARTIIAMAQAFDTGTLRLDASADPDHAIARLTALPGIGPWTAHYIAMRALRWPDAFPPGDVGIRNALHGATPKEAEALSQPWRPWRSYAVMHLWRGAPDSP